MLESSLQVAIVGYSGHAYVVLDSLERLGANVAGYFELQEQQANPYGLTFLGKDNPEVFAQLPDSYRVFPTIGDNAIRQRVVRNIPADKASGAIFDPSSEVSRRAKLGDCSYAGVKSTIGPMANIGTGVIVNTGAVVEHECQIGNFCHIAPGAVLAGAVNVGDGSFIGANAVVREGTRIGPGCTIGAGAVVVADCVDGQIYAGNPARPIRGNRK